MAKGSKRCYALYSGDTAAALLALGAKVRLVSLGGERTIPLENFFIDDGMHHTDMLPGELLAEVVIPQPADGQRGTYLKYRKRGAVDFPIVGVATILNEQPGLPAQVRIAVTGAGSRPFLIEIPQGTISGNTLTSEMIDQLAEAARKQAKPVSHMEVSPHHRKQLVGVLVKDALEKLHVC
jgi:4-hydroxybenzoyl-CoA reductase subunit beta